MAQNKTFSDKEKLSPTKSTEGYSKEFISDRRKVISTRKSKKQDIIKSKERGEYMDKCKETFNNNMKITNCEIRVHSPNKMNLISGTSCKLGRSPLPPLGLIIC